MSNLTMIQELRDQAKRFREAAAALERAAAILEGSGTPNGRPTRSKIPVVLPPKRRRAKTRRDQLEALLKENGPMRRRDIEAKSNIPKGSIATYLSPKHGFVKTPDGRWTVRDNHTEQGEQP